MALEKLHIKHLSKGWQLRSDGQKCGELYRTKADAMAAAESIARQSKNGLIVLIEPRPPRRMALSTLSVALRGSHSVVEERVPKVRYPKSNPTAPELVARAMLTPVERAEQFRKWAASHSNYISLPDAAFERESFYEDRD